MDRDSFDVVIAGAGPTGLLLAAEVALGGATAVVLERLASPDMTMKAASVGALASEALERRGFGSAFDDAEASAVAAMLEMKKKSGDGTSYVGPNPKGLRAIGGHFAGLFLIDQLRQREPERRFRMVSQQHLERIIGERVRELGVEVRRERAVAGFVDDGERVTVDVREPGGNARVSGRFLVGCDGGRSTVRKHAGFDFPGTDPTITGHQAIVELDHPEKLLPLGWRRTATGMLTYGPAPGRVLTVEFDGPPADRDAPITREEIQTSIRRVSGTDVTVTEVKMATRFTDNARQATTYRRGRVLLAGDAAHVHSPFGGQGLNLSLLDAMNLGWKLAADLRGWAPEALLDTYTSERHPAAARVLENTRAQIALMRPDPHTSALREIVARIMNLDEGNRFFGDMMSGLGTRYPIAGEHPLVGKLTANRALEGDATLFAAMRDGRGLLVDAHGGAAAGLAEPWKVRVQVVRAMDGPSLLVRPDGCIAWATDDGDTRELVPALHLWFGDI